MSLKSKQKEPHSPKAPVEYHALRGLCLLYKKILDKPTKKCYNGGEGGQFEQKRAAETRFYARNTQPWFWSVLSPYSYMKVENYEREVIL